MEMSLKTVELSMENRWYSALLMVLLVNAKRCQVSLVLPNNKLTAAGGL
ncbi:hypothetical protein C809_03224 [Lachnospiraceae bacterium MD335]|jgi:hypothetical protein|nr:hypothetical protein C809_03224 [Lachnospiraceae bacterium MD335]